MDSLSQGSCSSPMTAWYLWSRSGWCSSLQPLGTWRCLSHCSAIARVACPVCPCLSCIWPSRTWSSPSSWSQWRLGGMWRCSGGRGMSDAECSSSSGPLASISDPSSWWPSALTGVWPSRGRSVWWMLGKGVASCYALHGALPSLLASHRWVLNCHTLNLSIDGYILSTLRESNYRDVIILTSMWSHMHVFKW